MDWNNLFLSLDGRISRKPYWIGVLSILVATLILYQIANWLGLFSWQDFADPQSSVPWINLVITLLLVYPGLAVTIKRLHDRNRTGWWGGLLYGLAVLSTILDAVGLSGTQDEPSMLGLVFGLAVFVIAVWFFIELGFLRGTQGPNRFGPDPLGARQADASL